MQKAFLFAEAPVMVGSTVSEKAKRVVIEIVSRAVIVITPEITGEAVIVAGEVITSLYLVRNYSIVTVIFPKGETYPAAIQARDEHNCIAKLKPLALGCRVQIDNAHTLRIAPGIPLDAPLFAARADEQGTQVRLASMLHNTRLGSGKENLLQIQEKLDGLSGGGVWNMEGEFKGLTIGRSAHDPESTPIAYALPAEDVMNFAETRDK